MSTPEFVLALREKIGHDPLWLPGVAGVVTDADNNVLLAQRSDNGQWTTLTGILDPGEEPAVGIIREIEEETGVRARVKRLLGVSVTDPVQFPNRDRAQFLTVEFHCVYEGGVARVNDDESTHVAWFAPGTLPEMGPQHRSRIERALNPALPLRF